MTYSPIGFYVTCDDAACSDCFDPASWEGFEGWDEPLAIFTDSESDTPTHCVECDALIEHALTTDGYLYVIDALCDAEAPVGDVLEAWRDAYVDAPTDPWSIAEALHVLTHDYGLYAVGSALSDLGFRPSPMLRGSTLDDDGRAAYAYYVPDAARTDPYAVPTWAADALAEVDVYQPEEG